MTIRFWIGQLVFSLNCLQMWSVTPAFSDKTLKSGSHCRILGMILLLFNLPDNRAQTTGLRPRSARIVRPDYLLVWMGVGSIFGPMNAPPDNQSHPYHFQTCLIFICMITQLVFYEDNYRKLERASKPKRWKETLKVSRAVVVSDVWQTVHSSV